MNLYLVSNEYPSRYAPSRDSVLVIAADIPAARAQSVPVFRDAEWERAGQLHRRPDPECWDVGHMDARLMCVDTREPWAGELAAGRETS